MNVQVKEYSFIAEFIDGYSFRNLFEYLKGYHDVGQFTFKSDGIHFIRSNNKADLINEFWIKAKELTLYEFNESSPITKGVDVALFKAAVAIIGKKDSVKWSLFKNSDSFNIQLMGHNNKDYDGNIQKIPIKNIEEQEIEMDECKRSLDDPNFVWPLSDVAKSCKPISTGCSHIYIYQYKKGIKIEKNINGTAGEHFCKFGRIDEKDNLDNQLSSMSISQSSTSSATVNRIKIRSENIKNLHKINNLSEKTNMRFYFEESGNQFIRLSCNIGCYGLLTIYMLNVNDEK